MPRKAPSKENAAKFVFRGFIRCELNVSERDDYNNWSGSTKDTDLWEMVLKLADSGYKYSVGENNNGMVASLSNYDGPSDSRGYILSAHGGSADRATRALFYKHYVKLAEDWPMEQGDAEWDLR